MLNRDWSPQQYIYLLQNMTLLENLKNVLYVYYIHYSISYEGLKVWETYIKGFKVEILLRMKVEAFADAIVSKEGDEFGDFFLLFQLGWEATATKKQL